MEALQPQQQVGPVLRAVRKSHYLRPLDLGDPVLWSWAEVQIFDEKREVVLTIEDATSLALDLVASAPERW